MKKEEILERMKTIIASIITNSLVDFDAINFDSDLRDDLAMESLDMIDLVMTTETTFGIKVDIDNAKHVRTVGDWIDYIEPFLKDKQ